MPARSIDKATISFGLVSIPVKLYTSSESSGDIHFNLLHDACGSRLRQQYLCTKEDVVVDREHMVKGYEFAKGQYVVLKPEEIKALDAVGNNAIDLNEFVPADALDPLWVEKTYYLGPDKGGERAYSLIRDAMLETGLVGVASYAARGKQYVVAIRPYKDGLILHQLRYNDEVKDWKEVPLGDLPEVKDSELKLATQIIQQISSETWDPKKYKDEVRERVLELIQGKVEEGQEITAAPEAPQGKIIDLMEALKQSLGMQKGEAAAAGEEERRPAKAADDADEEKASKKKRRKSG
jgi:DNA end-binding protein Ku